MSSTSELSSFAARLRGFIDSASTPARVPADLPAFGQLALELFTLQFEHNAPYRRFCEAHGAQPGLVNHWADIPAMPTSAFKEWDLSCLPARARTVVFYSSGTTTQQPSRHFHNAESLTIYEASLLAWFHAYVQFSIGNSQLAILTPPPDRAPHSSLVHMFETIRRSLAKGGACVPLLASPGGSPFVGNVTKDGSWSLDFDAARQLLHQACEARQPLLLLGTAFSFVHLLDHLAGETLRFQLPLGSCAMETGGYKGRSRVLTKADLHTLISKQLGIPSSHIVCEYGMSELSSQAYDCVIGSSRLTQHTARRFHFPAWARVQIISPETGHEVGEGETGLIRVFDLANVYSVMAIQTEDLGIRCAKGFSLLGRAATAEPRGCSLATGEA